MLFVKLISATNLLMHTLAVGSGHALSIITFFFSFSLYHICLSVAVFVYSSSIIQSLLIHFFLSARLISYLHYFFSIDLWKDELPNLKISLELIFSNNWKCRAIRSFISKKEEHDKSCRFCFMIVDNNDSHLKIVRNIILKSKLLFLILRLTKIIFFCIIMMTNDYHFAKQLIHSLRVIVLSQINWYSRTLIFSALSIQMYSIIHHSLSRSLMKLFNEYAIFFFFCWAK